jgi:hypothetical protein
MSVRKPHQDFAGYKAELRNEFSGGHTIILDCKLAQAQGTPLVEDYIAEGGRYQILCNEHGRWHDITNCGSRRNGVHYNIWNITQGGVEGLRTVFPDAKVDEMNFVLFSTSGVHGTYSTIEEIEASLVKYGPDPDFMKDESDERIPDDYCSPSLTVLVCHPRIVGFGYGVVEVTLEDIDFLKRLRASSWEVVQTIGK